MEHVGRPVKVFQGRVANSHIFHCGDGYFFHVREKRGHTIRLQCRHYHNGAIRCPATASLDLRTKLLQHSKKHRHTHAPDPLLKQDMDMRRSMVNTASQERYGSSITRILLDHKLKCSNPQLASRFPGVRMYSALHAARADNYPKIPQTLVYLGVLLGLPNTRRICETVDKTDFIFQGIIGCEAGKTVALVFISGRMIHVLNDVENVHGDGTFKKKSRKPHMAQIFNLTTQFGTSVICLARVLMMSRKGAAYDGVFSYLKSAAPSRNLRRIHCDYERQQMKSFKTKYPLARVVGCLWHYGVAFSSMARKLGLSDLASEDEKVYDFIRCLGSVPLLPQHLMWKGVCDIWGEIEDEGLDDEFLPLLQYFEREWKPRRDELSVFGMPERTNNCSESDNRAMASFIPQNGPNIYHLLGAFVQMEYVAYCDVIAIRRGDAVSASRRYRTCLNDANVRRLSTLLVAKQISPAQFLHSVSFVNSAAVNHGLHLTRNEESSSEED